MTKKRYKPSPGTICRVSTADYKGRLSSIDINRVGGRGMLPWLKKHGHIRSAGGQWYVLTRKGDKMSDKACDLSHHRGR